MELPFGLTYELLVQISLILVLMVQVGYLARQTNFFRRSSQTQLTETWITKFSGINTDLLLPEDPNGLPNLAQFNELVLVFSQLHTHFREKLLKPSDFTVFFLILFKATYYEQLRKSKSYEENFLHLQNTFNDFNNDVDAVLYLLNLLTPSMYSEMLDKIKMGSFKKTLIKGTLTNWASSQTGFRLGAWFSIKIRNIKFFELKPPIYEK